MRGRSVSGVCGEQIGHEQIGSARRSTALNRSAPLNRLRATRLV